MMLRNGLAISSSQVVRRTLRYLGTAMPASCRGRAPMREQFASFKNATWLTEPLAHTVESIPEARAAAYKA